VTTYQDQVAVEATNLENDAVEFWDYDFENPEYFSATP
jgi:hypothetical protein